MFARPICLMITLINCINMQICLANITALYFINATTVGYMNVKMEYYLESGILYGNIEKLF